MPGWIAAAALGGGALGAIGSILGGNKQANAAQNAANIQQNMYQAVQRNEQPYMAAGVGAQKNLNYLLGTAKPGGPNAVGASAGGGYGSLITPFTAQNFHDLSPAYQFQLQQGQQGVLNNSASGQGAESGAAMKDLIGYNQGMANTSFNNAFNQYQTQQGNIFSQLASIAQLGSSAGSNSTTGASNFGSSIGQSVSNVGTAQGGATVGAANSLMGGLNNAALSGYLNNTPGNNSGWNSNATAGGGVDIGLGP